MAKHIIKGKPCFMHALVNGNCFFPRANFTADFTIAYPESSGFLVSGQLPGDSTATTVSTERHGCYRTQRCKGRKLCSKQYNESEFGPTLAFAIVNKVPL